MALPWVSVFQPWTQLSAVLITRLSLSGCFLRRPWEGWVTQVVCFLAGRFQVKHRSMQCSGLASAHRSLVCSRAASLGALCWGWCAFIFNRIQIVFLRVLDKVPIKWYLPIPLSATIMKSSGIQGTQPPFWRWPLQQWKQLRNLKMVRVQALRPKDRLRSQCWQPPEHSPGWSLHLPQPVSPLKRGSQHPLHRSVCVSPWELRRLRKWQPAPVFLPGKSQGQRSLVGYLHGVAKSQTRLSSVYVVT